MMKQYNFYAPCNTSTSYGLVAYNIVKNDMTIVNNKRLFPISSKVEFSGMFESLRKIDGRFNTGYDPNLPCVKLYHEFDLFTFIGKGQQVGFPIFELDTLKPQAIIGLKSLDTIFVCSDWAKEIIAQNGINVDTRIVPLGVDRQIFAEPKIQKQDRPYVFFSCGKWEVRKNQDAVVRCFNKAFTIKDKVELYMMMDNPFYSQDFMNEKKNTYLSTQLKDKIKIINRVETQEHLARIMGATDCGIFPSRAEGWNLEALEMMSCGKDIIISNYSGHTQFVNEKNSYLINPCKLIKAVDNKWFLGEGNWADFDDDEIIEAMRAAYQKGPCHVNHEGINTAKQFTWTNTVKSIQLGLSNV